MDKSQTLVPESPPFSLRFEERRLLTDAGEDTRAAVHGGGPVEPRDVPLPAEQTSPPGPETAVYHRGRPGSDFSAGQTRRPDMRDEQGCGESVAIYESADELGERDLDDDERARLLDFLEDQEDCGHADLGRRQLLHELLGYGQQPAPLRQDAWGQESPPGGGDLAGYAHARHLGYFPLHAGQQEDMAARWGDLTAGAFVVRLDQAGPRPAAAV